MQVNRAFDGVLKGMGSLEGQSKHKRRFFPNIRNVHKIEMSHAHPSTYKTTTANCFPIRAFQPAKRVYRNANESNVPLTKQGPTPNSTSKQSYQSYGVTRPPSLIRPKQQGVALGNNKMNEYRSTTIDHFGGKTQLEPDINYRMRHERFNPITGEQRNQTFAFEDFRAGNKGYKAHNVVGTSIRRDRFTNNIW